MRDLMVLGATSVLLILCLRNTFSAYLIWGWSGLIALNTYVYGFMVGVPYVQIFATIALALVLMKRDPLQTVFTPTRTSVLFIIFGLHAVASATFAEPYLARNWELCTNLLKTLLYCLVMPILVTNRLRVHAMVIMLVLAISFHSGLDGLKFIASGGSHFAVGNPKLGDNNHFALIIILVLPLLLYLYRYSAKSLIRYSFLGVLIITTMAVVATRSRGGLLTIVTVAAWIILKSKRKASGIVLMALAAMLVIQFAPESWKDRMETINQAGQDTSFMGRVTAWKRASAIAVEHPVFGGGFHAGQAPSLFEQYRYKDGLLGFVPTPDVSYPAASHSIYFEVMGDLGFVGLLIFLSLIWNASITGGEINKIVKSKGEHLLWASDLSDMLKGALIVYVIGGALLSVAYYDFPYIIMMMLETLKQVALRSVSLKNDTPANLKT